MRIKIGIKFHPVGFGLFSSGNIGNFKYVYDCGELRSNIRVNKCIENEFDEETNLDLIVISHFHQDHINGIERLLKVIKSVDTIILPYITPKDRLIYLLSYWKDNGKAPSKWIESFIIDPASTLLKGSSGEKIKNLVFIFGKSQNLPENTNDKASEDQKIFENDNLSFDINDLPVSDEENSIKQNEGITDSKISIRENGRISLKSAGTLTPIWQFIFYYCNPSKNIVRYINEIINIFNIKKGKIDKNTLAEIVKKGGLKTISRNIRLSDDEINNTSLLLYHSCIFSNLKNNIWNCYISIQSQIIHECYFHHFKRSSHLEYESDRCFRCAYFYTGDVNLKVKHREIQNYYNSLLDNIMLLQVPHHGSEKNWDSHISNSNKGMFHVISSEFANENRLHPDESVLYEILQNNGYTAWCNEKHPLEIEGYIYFVS